MEEADISSGCSVWNRTSKLILRRLLWHCRALICCQYDEDPGPVPPFFNTQALIRQTFHVFYSPPSSPSPECSANIKVKEVRDAYVRSAPMIAAFSSWRVLVRSILMPLPLLNGSLILQNTLLCENNLNDAVPDITAPKRCSSMKRKQAIIDVNGLKMLRLVLI